MAEWRRRNPDKVLAAQHRSRLKRRGATPEDYSRFLGEQGGRCAICRTETPGRDSKGRLRRVFNLDHCHATGVLRGVLCVKCNVGLANFRDNPALLGAAALYLSRHRTLEAAS